MASSRALTSTSTLSLVKRLSPFNASPVLIRSSRFSTCPLSNDEYDSQSKQDFCPLENPFLKEGPEKPFETQTFKDKWFARLDLPGIQKEGLRLWIQDNRMHLEATEQLEVEDPIANADGPRIYEGSEPLPEDCNLEEIDAELKNGVLKVKIAKIKVEKKKPFYVNVK